MFNHRVSICTEINYFAVQKNIFLVFSHIKYSESVIVQLQNHHKYKLHEFIIHNNITCS